MRLFKPKYKDKSGKTKQVAKWWVEFRDPNGIVRRWGLSTTDKDVADITANQIGSLNEWAKKGLDPKPDIVKWVRRQGPKFRDKIYAAGLLSPDKMNLTKPILERLEDYRNALLINSKGRYPRQTIKRIGRIIDGCGFEFWFDVDGEKINKYIAGRYEDSEDKLGRHTGQAYIRAFRQFANWLEKKGRITHKPVIETVKFDRKERRAFEFDEWQRLLEATRKGEVRSCMSGWTRQILYAVGMETGFRLEELSSLTRSSFNFNDCTVFVPSKDTKNGKAATQRITPETAQMVKELVKDMMPTTRLFHLTVHAPDMIRYDCSGAGIETTNHKGTINFHSLRHTCATFLVAKGVDVKTVQTIMRHQKVETTLAYYTHVLSGSVIEGINALRNIGQAPAKEQTA